MADSLRTLATNIEENAVECEPYAMAVVVLGQYDSDAGWLGIGYHTLPLIGRTLMEKIFSRRYARARRNVVAEEIQSRIDSKNEQRAYEVARPFACNAKRPCSQRFKSERGRQMHLARSRMHRES